MIDIKDDFLPEEIIHDLEWVIMGQNFAWFLQNEQNEFANDGFFTIR